MGGYDCVVVGARCSGAPLARFLARAGKRVVVVDAAVMLKDQPLSTHFIHPFGMRILDEIGLGDRVRTIAPPVDLFRTGIGDDLIELRWSPGHGGSCPRRSDLDALLLEGAREAGAEVRLGCRVIDLVRDGERVVGVIVEEDGVRSELRADIVVGADGRNSTIAEKVGAEEYNVLDSVRGAYWAYWPRPSWYATDPRYQGGTLITFDDRDFRFVFPANTDQLLVGFGFPNTDDLAPWKQDPLASLRAKLGAHRLTAPLIDGDPVSKVIGLTKLRFFFRRAAGPGWALVGDAGLHKDPTPGFGISDALRDARALAAAIIEGGDAALERYWRQRDADTIELYYFARDLGGLDYNNALNRLVYKKIVAKPELSSRLIDMFERRISPYKTFSVPTVLSWTLGAMLRGNFGVLGPFFKAGKIGSQVERERKARAKLVPKQLPSPR